MVLRTNPKLTGNVKLVVDTDYNIYIDTFKASLVKNGAEFTVCLHRDPCFVLISLLDLNFDSTCQ